VLQLDAFADIARARRSDPATSHQAAARVNGPKLADLVLAEISRGEGTSHEIAARLGLSLVTVSPRMRPLQLQGRIEAGGRRDGRTVWRRV